MIVLVAVFLRLGWWQFQKGRSNSDLQNLFYGIEWPFFAGCVIFGWWRMITDELGWSPSGDADAAFGEPGGQPAGALSGCGAGAPGTPAGSGPESFAASVAGAASASTAGSAAGPPDEDFDDEEDIELAEYNRYLAALAARDDQRSGR